MDLSSQHLRTPTTIGVLVFNQAPRDYLPPLRLRALAAEAAMQNARLALFCADDCDIESGLIGVEIWTWDGWRSIRVPVPDLVIIVTNPLRERHQRVNDWICARATVIADYAPNKAALSRLLAGTPLAHYVIPYAEVSADDPAGQIESWLQSRGDCVVKPVDGKRGGGIYRIHAEPAGDGWQVRKDDRSITFPTQAIAASYVTRQIAGRLHYRRFIVQSYIRSISLDGRAADFRVHLQKDGAGMWCVTRSYVRLGEVGVAISNISRGGYQGPVESFFATRRVRSASDLAAELETLALCIARMIEAAQADELSELGVDLAIDEQDRFWLIEANARPQSSLHEHLRAVRTIAYALYLAAGSRARTSAMNESTISVKVPATTDA